MIFPSFFERLWDFWLYWWGKWSGVFRDAKIWKVGQFKRKKSFLRAPSVKKRHFSIIAFLKIFSKKNFQKLGVRKKLFSLKLGYFPYFCISERSRSFPPRVQPKVPKPFKKRWKNQKCNLSFFRLSKDLRLFWKTFSKKTFRNFKIEKWRFLRFDAR